MSDLRFTVEPQKPGDYLEEALSRLDMSQAELARRASLSRKHVHELIEKGAPLTPDVAARISRATGRPTEFWLQVEAAWRAHEQSQHRTEESAGWVEWAEQFPLSALNRRNIMPGNIASRPVVDSLLDFFGVVDPDAFEKVWGRRQLAYRRGHDADGDVRAIQAWIRLGELAAHQVPCRPYDEDRLKQALPQLRAATERPVDEGWRTAREILSECGVALVMIEEFKPLTKINGAANWLKPDKVAVQVSSRTNRVDVLWFNIFHELGHVLHDTKRKIRIGQAGQASPPEDEAAADRFAQHSLIPPEHEPELRTIYKKQPTLDFAERLGLGVDIVAGRLLNDGQLKYQHGWGPRLLRYYGVEVVAGLAQPTPR